MDLVYRGLALVLAAGAVLARFPEPIPTLGRGRLFELVPVPAVIGLIVLAIGYVLYRHTSLGRYAIAIGGNEEAATLTGIRVDRNKIYHYMLMGALAALAGIVITGRLNAIQATSATGLALHTIAAVVVGGTSLFGGRGSMLGTLVGVLLLSMVVNALVTLRFEFFWQQVASGIIIILSVGFYSYLQRGAGGAGLGRRLRSWAGRPA
jgi:ribose/xylose/arabinose/galactoside ABC-type transport system permease subunit